MRILIIEDEKKVARFIVQGLREHGYIVDVRHDGEAGLRQALAADYMLIILDVMLPGKDGFSVLAELRASACNSRVLLLSALYQSQHKVKGLNLGADDYLAKPFDFDELIARVNALLRRDNYEAREVLEAGDLLLNSRSMVVERSGVRIDLLNASGRLVRTLVDETKEAGRHSIVLNADQLNSGVYFYRLTAPGSGPSLTKKMLLVK
ncbi:MAG: response regulator [Bacteroidetes bacterium]|nr:response regulator [Bacteroidota bacterium]